MSQKRFWNYCVLRSELNTLFKMWAMNNLIENIFADKEEAAEIKIKFPFENAGILMTSFITISRITFTR